MTDRYLLVRKDGQPAQIPAGDSLRLRGAINEAPIVQVSLQTDSNRLRPDRDPANTLQVTSAGFGLQFIAAMPSGVERTVILNDLTIYHSARLQLIGKADIVAKAGDVARFVSLGSDVSGSIWLMTSYERADGTPLVGAPDPTKLPLAGGTMTGAFNEAPPSTIDVGVNPIGNILDWDLVPGNTAVTGVAGVMNIVRMVGATDGAVRLIKFGPGHVLSHSSGGLELPGSTTITTRLGDSAWFLRRTADRWQCTSYQRGDGTALVGTASGTGDKSYTHAQTTAATVWTIPHNLGKRPSVSVVDTLEEEVWPDVKYIDDNTVQITHGAAYAGKAYLN